MCVLKMLGCCLDSTLMGRLVSLIETDTYGRISLPSICVFLGVTDAAESQFVSTRGNITEAGNNQWLSRGTNTTEVRKQRQSSGNFSTASTRGNRKYSSQGFSGQEPLHHLHRHQSVGW